MAYKYKPIKATLPCGAKIEQINDTGENFISFRISDGNNFVRAYTASECEVQGYLVRDKSTDRFISYKSDCDIVIRRDNLRLLHALIGRALKQKA